MQRCPKCNRTYQDDSQKFCTFDGGRLMIDTDAPTTFDLGPAPHTDPMGATVTEHAPDLNKTVASAQPQLTSEIPASAPTGPTNQPPAWPAAPASSNIESAPTLHTPQPTGPTTTSPLTPPPASEPAPPVTTAPVPPVGMVSGATVTAPTMNVPAVTPPAAPPSGALPTTAPAKKSSSMPLILGGLVVLLLLVVGGGAVFYFLAMKPRVETAANTGGGPSLEKGTPSSSNTNASNNNTGNSNTGATASQPPVEVPPNSARFVNSRDKLTGSLAEHFVEFSLYYPNNWIVDQKAGTSASSNFFRATRQFQDKPDGYVLEIMSVGWYQSNGTMQLDRAIFPNRVEYFNNSLSKDFPEYQKVSEGETTLNGLSGYQFTFKSTLKDTDKGDINLWGRVIFLPVGSEDAKNGAVLIMVASSDLPEIKGVEDVGEKGELPIILKTFRLGSS